MSKAPSPVHLGVQTLAYEDAKRQRPVVIELWYPTDETAPFDQPDDVAWVHPTEMRDVALSNRIQKYPLIMMSHGHTGDRRDRSWLAQYLVQNGYIVASIEHEGNSWRSYNPMVSLRFWERAQDITFAITSLLEDSTFQDRLDSNKIGFVGYSLGGMTGLALAGAKAHHVKEIVLQHQEKLQEVELSIVKEMDFAEAYADFIEPRIKAMVLLSPANFIYPPQSLNAVKVPVALITSEGDEVLPFKEHALQLIKHLVPAKVKLLKKHVSHYVFLNRVSDIGKTLVREELHTDQLQSDRASVHKEVGNYTVSFFNDRL